MLHKQQQDESRLTRVESYQTHSADTSVLSPSRVAGSALKLIACVPDDLESNSITLIA
jgi:hypothetical protein